MMSHANWERSQKDMNFFLFSRGVTINLINYLQQMIRKGGKKATKSRAAFEAHAKILLV